MSNETGPPAYPPLRRPQGRAIVLDSDKPGTLPESFNAVSSALVLNDLLPGLVMHEPTAILLDINNLYRRAKENRFAIDYGKLKAIFETRCDLRHIAAFSAVDRQDPGATRWVDFMEDKGYSLVIKDLRRYTNRMGQNQSKGNMDTELTIAATKLSSAFAHVIIGSCDSDFVPLIEHLKEGHFRKVSVLGMTNPEWTGMSQSLIQSADNFYDIDKMRNYVEYIQQDR